jgi:hypothetical protein
MWPQAWLVIVGFLVSPLTAITPSCRNLPALLPELCGILASLYHHCRHELLLFATAVGLRR